MASNALLIMAALVVSVLLAAAEDTTTQTSTTTLTVLSETDTTVAIAETTSATSTTTLTTLSVLSETTISATTAPSTTLTQLGNVVLFSVTVDGVDYDALMANRETRDAFVANVKSTTAELAGSEILPEHVSVELAAGSVAVRATITPPNNAIADTTAEKQVQSALAGAISSGAMEQAVITAVSSVPGIDQVSSGSIRLSNQAVQIEFSTSTTTSTPMGTVGTGAPLMGATRIVAIVSGVLIALAVISLVVVFCMLREQRQPKESAEADIDLEKQAEVAEQSVTRSENGLEQQVEVAEQSVTRSEDDIEMQTDVVEQSRNITI